MKNLKYLIGIVAVFFAIVYLAVVWRVIKLPAGQNQMIFRDDSIVQPIDDLEGSLNPVEFESDAEVKRFIIGVKNDEYNSGKVRTKEEDELIREINKEVRDRVLSTLNEDDYRLLRGDDIWTIPFFVVELNKRGYETLKLHPEVLHINEDTPVGPADLDESF